MSQDTAEYADAADKRAKTVAGISGGLLLLLPGFIKNFELPHEAFWLIGTSAALGAVSLLFATTAFLIADANSRRIALSTATNWSGYHKTYGLAVYSFAAAVIAFALFSIVNSSDFTQPSFGTIDIVLDKPVAGPEETIEIEAVLDDRVNPDHFEWTASGGMLLDSNERSITWLSPSGVEESNWIEISVLVRAGNIEKTESTRILFISPIAEESKTSEHSGNSLTTNLIDTHTAQSSPTIFAAPHHRNENIRNYDRGHGRATPVSLAIKPDITQQFATDSGFTLPGPRQCCSQSIKPWPLCDSKC